MGTGFNHSNNSNYSNRSFPPELMMFWNQFTGFNYSNNSNHSNFSFPPELMMFFNQFNNSNRSNQSNISFPPELSMFATPRLKCTSRTRMSTDAWCDANCNHVPAYCPIHLCDCKHSRYAMPHKIVEKHHKIVAKEQETTSNNHSNHSNQSNHTHGCQTDQWCAGQVGAGSFCK